MSPAQDARRAIFEERSHHIAIGLAILPGVADRLHRAREPGEPFDFPTWCGSAPEQSGTLRTMVRRLRDADRWRDVDIRLAR